MSEAGGKLTAETVRYLAFEGGGAMGVAYLGALVALEEMGVTPNTGSTQVEGVSGTSIGALVAMCVGMGYSANDINARLVRDRVFRVLHAEPFRLGVARKFTYDGNGDPPADKSSVKANTTGAMSATPGEVDQAWPVLRALAAKKFDKAAQAMVDNLTAFLSDWLSGTATAMLSDDRLFTDFIYDGALRALRGRNAEFIRGAMFNIDWVRSLFDEAAGDNQFFLTQFNEWVQGQPFEEGVFESTQDRERYVFQVLGMAALGVLAYYTTALALGGEKKDGLRNKFLLLQVIVENYLFNAFQPWLYRGWSNILNDLARVVRAARMDVGQGALRDSFRALEDRIGAFVLQIFTSDHFQALQQQIIGDGALFSGLTVRCILAEAIYARVEVDEDGNFTKREHQIEWGDETLRENHPALTGKAEEQVRDEYARISRLIFDERSKVSHRDYRRAYKRLEELDKNKEAADALDEERQRQVRAIMEGFTIEDYAQVFGVELCVTGTNITTGKPVYFNRYLTPAMPVVDAVGISSSFPFLFKPTYLKYTGARTNQNCYVAAHVGKNVVDAGVNSYAPKDLTEWYRANYPGWFIDGGLLNNIPIHAFNGHGAASDDALALDPVNMRHQPLNPDVLALVLDKLDHPKSKKPQPSWKSKVTDFEGSQSPPPLLSQFMGILYEAPGVHATYSALSTTAFNRKQVVLLDVPSVSLFDIVPIESSLRETDWTGYEAMWAHFGSAAGTRQHKDKDGFAGHFGRDNKKGRRWRKNPSMIAQRAQSRKLARKTARWRDR